MRLEDQRESENVEDRRGGGGMRKAGGVGIGTIVIALVASYFLGIDPSTILNVAQVVQGPAQVSTPGKPLDPSNDPNAKLAQEMRRVLGSTEDVWANLFRQMGGNYQAPKLVLFTGATPTACGAGQAAMGPFYCPGDQKVYLDMDFFREMEQRFRSGGDFARAYVIAHEVAHHVQNQMGITGKTDAMRDRVSKVEYNKISVRVELQADCFAGAWAHHANRIKPILQEGDVEEAMRAANAIGDDALQRASRGAVVPDSFTHGTSQQRMRWFKQGLETGDLKSCDTFSARDL